MGTESSTSVSSIAMGGVDPGQGQGKGLSLLAGLPEASSSRLLPLSSTTTRSLWV